MLRSLKPLHLYTVQAEDGAIGRVHDFYFHDDTWAIRHMVVDTGPWLNGRKVLVNTGVLGKPNWDEHTFPVALTREQIKQSPPIDTDKPVSRQQEARLHNDYGRPLYWREPDAGVCPPFAPPVQYPDAPTTTPESETKEEGDPHLRSVREVTGYHVHASDGSLGHIKDVVVDDALWVIRYMVVDLSHWMPTKKVLISPQWLRAISYVQNKVEVGLTREAILNCPEFRPTDAVNREFEERLYDYYGRPVYWSEGHPAQKKPV